MILQVACSDVCYTVRWKRPGAEFFRNARRTSRKTVLREINDLLGKAPQLFARGADVIVFRGGWKRSGTVIKYENSFYTIRFDADGRRESVAAQYVGPVK